MLSKLQPFISSVLLAILLLLCGCSSNDQNSSIVDEPEEKLSPGNVVEFVEVDQTHGAYIVYDKITKVMYAVSCGKFNQGTFTVLVNADGTPMLYEE